MALVMNRNNSISGHVPPVPSRDGRASYTNVTMDRGYGINKFHVNPETPPPPPAVTSIPKRTLNQSPSMKHNPHSPASVQNVKLNNSLQPRFSANQSNNGCPDSSNDDSHPHIGTTAIQRRQLPPLPDSVTRIHISEDVPPPLPQRPRKHTDIDFEDRFCFHNVKEFPEPGPMEIQPQEKIIKTSSKITKQKNNHQGHQDDVITSM